MKQFLRKFTFKDIIALMILGALIILHLYLLSKTFFIDPQGNMRAAVAGYGDIPFHMTQVSKFAFGRNFNLNEPIYDGERLRYAFLINLISGNVLRISNNWTFAMQAPAMTLMASGIILMFVSYRKFLKSSLAGAIAVVLFLFGSGLGGYFLVQNQFIEQSRNPVVFTQYLVDKSVSTISRWDAKFPEQNIDWGSPLSLVFLHQRAFILGFFMFCLFWYLINKWREESKNNLLLVLTAVVVGISPLAHYHSFIVMIMVLAVYFVWGIINRKYNFSKKIIVILLVAGILALPQIIYLVQGKAGLTIGDQSFLKIRLGWMIEPTIGSIQFAHDKGIITGQIFPFINFIWINFGLLLPAFLLTVVFAFSSIRLRRIFPTITILTTIAIVLFITAQLVRFQPWDYDNNKIFVYFQFFAAPVIIAFFVWIYQKSKIVGVLTLLIFMFCATFSGLLDQIPRLLVPTEQMPVIFGTDAISMGNYIKENIPQNAKIITTSTHLNPVSSLAGMPALVGYPGWLWTRGINYGIREENLRAFYSDPIHYKNIPIIYGAKYVLIDPTAIYDWKAATADFDSKYKLLFRVGQYSLYQIT
jgi:hypothetical protein